MRVSPRCPAQPTDSSTSMRRARRSPRRSRSRADSGARSLRSRVRRSCSLIDPIGEQLARLWIAQRQRVPFHCRLARTRSAVRAPALVVRAHAARVRARCARVPVLIKRALALKNSLLKLEIGVENEELIVGNRTKGVRYGVIFPESGSSWIDREIEDLPTRAQDKFNVKIEDIEKFRKIIKPYWEGHSLEDVIRKRYGKEIDEIAKVVKINQKDHAQGHICPNCKEWLQLGPEGIKQKALKKIKDESNKNKDFYESVVIVMEGTQEFMMRYHDLMKEKANTVSDEKLKSSMLCSC